MAKKLYILRNVDGEPNYDEISILRKIENKLIENEAYIGLAPFGSVVSGYNIEGSDLDIYALYDRPKGTGSDAVRSIKDLKKEVEDDVGIKINLIEENINSEMIKQDIRTGISRGNPGEFVSTVLAEMSRMVTGKKIENYRKDILIEMQKLSPEQKQQLFDSIVESLARRDALSLYKRTKRMEELSKEDHQEIIEKRKEMWQERVRKIWGL